MTKLKVITHEDYGRRIIKRKGCSEDMSKRVLITSVYVDSVDKHIPIIIAIEKRVNRLTAAATRFGWVNKLIESLETKQDLSSGEYKRIQKELITKIEARVSSKSPEEFRLFSDEENPSKIRIVLNIEG